MLAARPRPYAVVNPRAALGKTRRLWPALYQELSRALGVFPWDWTERPLHAAALVRNALTAGHDLIISVGGDGTLNEVVNGFFDDQKSQSRRAALAVVPCGSGGDFRRSLGLDGSVRSALAAILAGDTREVDVGRLSYRSFSGEPAARLFINIASFGLSARVAHLVCRQPSYLGGSGRFFLATLQALLSHRNQHVSLEVDGEPLPPQILNTAAVANGRFFGGGMQIAPRAVIDDGLLDLVLLGEVGLRDFLLWGPRLYRGRHLSHPRIQYRRISTISATDPASVMVEVDGEPLGTLPTALSLLPRALRVRVNPGAPGLASL
ncbi:MAG TPA: diacylglycerol kinase family protein [Syntrophobacteria bacterium]|nr:diacylglycerol kinase family protein [Syntrophobacteria bacterium]